MVATEIYEQTMTSQLMEWNDQINAEITDLCKKATGVDEDQRARCYEEIAELRIKQQFLKDKMQELQEAIHDAWSELETEIGYAWQDLKTSIDNSLFSDVS